MLLVGFTVQMLSLEDESSIIIFHILHGQLKYKPGPVPFIFCIFFLHYSFLFCCLFFHIIFFLVLACFITLSVYSPTPLYL